MQLITPSIDYEKSYRSYLDELGDGMRVPFPLDYPHDPFKKLVEKLNQESLGVGLSEGFVPSTTFWLLDEEEIVGVSNLRHSLTPALEIHGGHIGYGIRPSAQRKGLGSALLRLTLVEAKRIGIQRALITCSKENRGSIGVIKANNGVYESEAVEASSGITIQRYWIET